MIRTVLTEIGVFLIPFAVYAIFLIATRSGVMLPASWPLDMLAKLTLAALVLRPVLLATAPRLWTWGRVPP